MIRPRWLAQLWANLNGYFWLPCPVCGEFFAGFECGENGLFSVVEPHRGMCVCRKAGCQSYARAERIAVRRFA